MSEYSTQQVRARILSLIDSEFESDAAFERQMQIPEKTVNNWRRGRSSSFMKMLPALADQLGVHLSELMDMPLRGDTSDLSDEEMHLLNLYRRARFLPSPMRQSLRKTLETTIELYLSSYQQIKLRNKQKK